MVSMKMWMLGAAMLAGMAGLGATTAQAAPVRVYEGSGPIAYAPPYPGTGCFWMNGYYSNGYWMAAVGNSVSAPLIATTI